MSNIGVFNTIQAFAALFCTLAQLGLHTYGVRLISGKDKETCDSVATSLLLLQLCLTVLVCTAYIVAVTFFAANDVNQILFFIFSLRVALTGLATDWLFKGREQYNFLTYKNVAVKCVTLIGVIGLVRTTDDLSHYIFIVLTGEVLSFGINAVFLKVHFTLPSVRTFKEAFWIFRDAIPLSSMLLATVYLSNIDKIMISVIKNDYDVGLYSGGYKAVYVFIMLVYALSQALTSRSIALYEQGQLDSYNNVVRRSFRLFFIYGISCVVILLLHGETLIMFYAGDDFRPAAQPLQILAPAIFFIGMSSVLRMQVFFVHGEDKTISFVTFVALGINIVLNSFLIPMNGVFGGINGASIATLISEVTTFLLLGILYKKSFTYSIGIIDRSLFVYLACLGLFFAAASRFQLFERDLFEVVIELVIMAALIFVLLVIRKDPLIHEISEIFANYKGKKTTH